MSVLTVMADAINESLVALRGMVTILNKRANAHQDRLRALESAFAETCEGADNPKKWCPRKPEKCICWRTVKSND